MENGARPPDDRYCPECSEDLAVSFTALVERISSTGCVTCGEIAQRRVAANLTAPSATAGRDEPVQPDVDDRPTGGLAAWKAAAEQRTDRDREARGLDLTVNAGAYDVDAVPLGLAEIAPGLLPRKPKDPYIGDTSIEALMDPGVTPTGGGSSSGRSRTKSVSKLCGQPCDRGCGLGCAIRARHDGSHACAECRHAGGEKRGRPTIEKRPRSHHVSVRASVATKKAIEKTGKTASQILAELGAAIVEGRAYNPFA